MARLHHNDRKENTMSYYIAAILFAAGFFTCGYKIGNYLGWREGYRIAKVLERQRAEGVWVRNHQDGDGHWDYSPKKKEPQV